MSFDRKKLMKPSTRNLFSSAATLLLSIGFAHAASTSGFDPSKNRRAIRFSPGLKHMQKGNHARPLASAGLNINKTEQAVLKALDWLTQQQQPDGYWQKTQSKVAHTGLAALCYFSYGIMPSDKTKHGQALDKGLNWLITQPNEKGDMRDGDKMYGQAIGALTMAEAYILTKDEKYKKPLSAAIKFIVKGQHPKSGGWRHQPYPHGKHPGDLSITGWVYMALQSAKSAGVKIPESNMKAADGFISSLASGKKKGLYGYLRPHPTTSMTSVGMFCMQQAESKNKERQNESARHMVTNLPTSNQKLRGTGYYHYWYYGTMAMYLHGGDDWATWHDRITPVVLEKQNSDGSWTPQGPRAKHEGSVVTTAWATMALTVYYRCLPMLQRPQTHPPRKFTSNSPNSSTGATRRSGFGVASGAPTPGRAGR
jgi:hypothetical protein